MAHDPETLADAAELCRELEDRLGPDTPLRLRTLVEMLMIELERSMEMLREPRPERSDGP